MATDTTSRKEVSRRLITKDGIQQYEIKETGTGEGGGKAKFTRYEFLDPNVTRTTEKAGRVFTEDTKGKRQEVQNYDSFRTDAENASQAKKASKAALPPSIPEESVSTTQPSPGKTPVGPQATSPEAQAAVDAGYVDSVDTYNAAVASGNDLAARMKTGLAQTKAQGGTAPDSQGAAATAMAGSVPQAPYTPPQPIQDEVQNSLQTYYDAIAEYMNPKNQRKTLVDEYRSISKSLGIDDLNDELLDINRIMDGTEDDIRSEVTAAGGFATESQVQAMTIGRNKSLLKKAQYISDQLTAAKDQLNTLSQLSAQDRQYADQRMQTGIQLLGNVVTMQQNMQKAAQDNYRWYAEKAGMDGLYQSTGGNAFNISMVEKTLGLPPGGLATAAAQATKQRALDEQKSALELDVLRSNLATDAMQRRNIQSQIDERNAASQPEAKQQRVLDTANLGIELLGNATGKKSAVGTSLAKLVPFGMKLGLQGERAAFENKVESLKANLTLDNLKLLKGAMSDKDLSFLQSVGSSLSTSMSEKEFDKEVYKIVNKLDPSALLQAGYTTSPDGQVIQIIK